MARDTYNARSKVPGDDCHRQSNNVSHSPREIQQQGKVAEETTSQRYRIQNDFPSTRLLSV